MVHFFADVCEKSVVHPELVGSNEIVAAMIAALHDDLNTSAVFGILFENMPILQGCSESKALVKYFIVHILGLTLHSLKESAVAITPEIQALIDQREQARKDKNWALSDQLRDQLNALGVQLHDKKS